MRLKIFKDRYSSPRPSSEGPFSIVSMKFLLILSVAFGAATSCVFAQSNPNYFGYGIEFSSTGPSAANSGTTLYSLVQDGGTRLLPTGSTATISNSWTSASGDSAATKFNLGAFNPSAGDTLLLKGGSILTYGTVPSSTNEYLNYRISPVSNISGNFAPGINLPLDSTDPSGSGNNDRRFATESSAVDVLNGLTPGTYVIDTYGYADGTYISNGGDNYAATFTVVPEPTTYLGGLLLIGLAVWQYRKQSVGAR